MMETQRYHSEDGFFQWNIVKDQSNQKKHGVSFSEASTVFSDKFSLDFDDEAHSFREKRFVIVGYSRADRLLFVSYKYVGDEEVRIISARPANPSEKTSYQKHLQAIFSGY
jgi:uncharacterized DUF497 family protein